MERMRERAAAKTVRGFSLHTALLASFPHMTSPPPGPCLVGYAFRRAQACLGMVWHSECVHRAGLRPGPWEAPALPAACSGTGCAKACLASREEKITQQFSPPCAGEEQGQAGLTCQQQTPSGQPQTSQLEKTLGVIHPTFYPRQGSPVQPT